MPLSFHVSLHGVMTSRCKLLLLTAALVKCLDTNDVTHAEQERHSAVVSDKLQCNRGTLHSFGFSASTVKAYLVTGLCQ